MQFGASRVSLQMFCQVEHDVWKSWVAGFGSAALAVPKSNITKDHHAGARSTCQGPGQGRQNVLGSSRPSQGAPAALNHPTSNPQVGRFESIDDFSQVTAVAVPIPFVALFIFSFCCGLPHLYRQMK